MTSLSSRSVRKIAVLRPSALGDCMFSLPALHALKAAYPGAEIVYLGRQMHAELMEGRPGPVDRVVVMPPIAGIGASPETDTGSACEEFIEEMQREQFDLAIQMFGGGRYANPLVRRFGAKMTIGMRTPDAAPLDRCLPFAGAVNRRLQLLELAALAGAQAWPMEAPFAITARDRALAAELLPLAPRQALVLIQPGATDRRRCWSAARFAAVADALTEENAVVAVHGTASEAPLVREIIAAMHHDAIDLSARASLPALCGLIARATLVVSNDTGPLHLALEIGTPCVGIYWFTNLVESAPLRQAGHRAALSLRVNCPLCGAENISSRCAHDASFVDDVPLEEVTALAIDLFRNAR